MSTGRWRAGIWVLSAVATGLAGLMGGAVRAGEVSAAQPLRDRYTPIPGGWQIRMGQPGASDNAARERSGTEPGVIDPRTGRLLPGAPIGQLLDDPRTHRRPLFPPADKAMIWTAQECEQTPTVSFRPMILAYNAPRFLFDYHSAGGLLGHLQVGLVQPGGGDKWLHQWTDMVVRYVEGRMEYVLQDDGFPGTTVHLAATPLATSAGLIVHVQVDSPQSDGTLVWTYGGASAFFTNWRLNAPEFSFAPDQCRKDRYLLKDRTFELIRAFDPSDGIVGGEGQSLGVMRVLKDWKAHVVGGSSWHGAIKAAAPRAFLDRPGGWATAPGATQPSATDEPGTRADCVVGEQVSLPRGQSSGFVVIGMGGDIRDAIAQPAAAWERALARNQSIASRIVTHTPDPYLDSAAVMMAFATEGTWASQAYVHGGWTWRFAYLGWRILYGPTIYGWTDRVRKTIENQCRLGRIDSGPDAGGLASLLESKGFFYNMNEVFLDMVRHYDAYTDDLALMREIFPVLEGMLERENRRLRPGPEALYESALNTWISDSHWYIRGQCTQASAYMLRAYEFMAGLAERLGKDPASFREHAARIRKDMNRLLWQSRPGVFAEYLDTRGRRLLHPEPELPTIYHAAEFGAADDLQIYQMLHWADTHLPQERTPGGGRLYWSSNWFPNNGRSYTHSTYELAYAEELNFAETNYLAGRRDAAYALIRASLSGIFNGPTPGGLSCHSFIDGTQRANDEFADASSMWGRTVCEGLFGIRVDRPHRRVKLVPQLPRDWPEGSIRTPHFSYRLRQDTGRVEIDWESPAAAQVALSLPIEAARVTGVLADDKPQEYTLRKGVGLTWLDALLPAAARGRIGVTFEPDPVQIPDTIPVRQGRELTLSLPQTTITEWNDPQGLLDASRFENGRLTGTVRGAPGPGVLFVADAQRACPRWIPVAIQIESKEPVKPTLFLPPAVSGRRLERWQLIDLASVYNAKVPEVPAKVSEGAIPPEMPADHVGFNYWKDHLTGRSRPPCDDAWRAKVGADGIAWTTDGIPFKSVKDGPNIAAVTLHNRVFPGKLSFPARARGSTLYLMISGMTHPVQSHVTNLRITLYYENGTQEVRDLVNPFDIGDCWSMWCNLHFDTPANGFENIGGRSGPAGSSLVKDRTRPVAVDTIAHLVAFALKPDTQLDRVSAEAIANDAVFGVMGASVLK